MLDLAVLRVRFQHYFDWKRARVNSFGRKSREPDQINKSLPQEMPACIYFTSTTAKHIMAASESQNAFSEVAVDKQKHSPVAACGGAQSSRSLSLHHPAAKTTQPAAPSRLKTHLESEILCRAWWPSYCLRCANHQQKLFPIFFVYARASASPCSL